MDVEVICEVVIVEFDATDLDEVGNVVDLFAAIIKDFINELEVSSLSHKIRFS